jgi:hypothetical protein
MEMQRLIVGSGCGFGRRVGLGLVAVAASGLLGCLPGDVFFQLGAADMGPRFDFVIDDAPVGPPPDLVRPPDLVGYTVPPDPFVPGTRRLAIGLFYEGMSSDQVPIDDTITHFYIYSSTANVADDRRDAYEGYSSQVISVTGQQPWFGMGIHWDQARDLSVYQKGLHVALKSSSASMADVSLGINSPKQDSSTVKVSATAFGYTNDGKWHAFFVPLSALHGIDPTKIGAPLVITNGAAAVKAGDSLKIDDVYYE